RDGAGQAGCRRCAGDRLEFAMSVLAGIDIGTLTCRLLIGRVERGGRLTELSGDRRILRLGEGVDRSRRLTPTAITRVVDTLKSWRQVVEAYRTDYVVVVATSAVRDAANREELLTRIRHETGWPVEIITGEEEARRTLLGIRAGLPDLRGELLCLDIGGGSTEVIFDRPGMPPGIQSLELGVVRLTERSLHGDPPTNEEVRRARRQVRRLVGQVRHNLGNPSTPTCVGTAGTLTTLAAMAQQLPTYDRERVHGYRVTLDTVRHLEAEVLRRTSAQRKELPGLEPGREVLIVAGILILHGVMDAFGLTTCVVSEYGLREGVLIDLAHKLTTSDARARG
ncbi:MAG: hypothetical protein ACREI3_12125, partial [Nitrospirales bacterium]